MTKLLEKYNKIVYIILAVLCAFVACISKQYYISIASPILILMAVGILDGRADEKQVISYEQLLNIFENKEDVENSTFYFSDDPYKRIHTIGYTKELEKPYHARYFDEDVIHYFSTAYELFTSPIYENESIKARWQNVVMLTIGGEEIRQFIKNRSNNAN